MSEVGTMHFSFSRTWCSVDQATVHPPPPRRILSTVWKLYCNQINGYLTWWKFQLRRGDWGVDECWYFHIALLTKKPSSKFTLKGFYSYWTKQIYSEILFLKQIQSFFAYACQVLKRCLFAVVLLRKTGSHKVVLIFCKFKPIYHRNFSSNIFFRFCLPAHCPCVLFSTSISARP